MRFLLISLTILFYSKISYSQANYYSPKNVLLFAEHLFEKEDYLRAIGEFQRYLFISNALSNDTIIFKIGLSYELSGNFHEAEKYYKNFTSEFPESSKMEHAHYQIAYMYFKNKDYIYSIEYLNNNLARSSSVKNYNKINLLKGVNLLSSKKWQEASVHFTSSQNAVKDTPYEEKYANLNNLALNGMHLSYRKPVFAGIFSSIIPGMGRIYSGRLYDGIYSFFLVGLTAWQSYDGFKNKGVDSLKGWFYGAISAAFYLGNIYGSIISARLYNISLEEKIIRKIDVNLNWNF